MYKYTLCFLKRNDEILMLNRDFAPVQGLWNGIGGKIKVGETPLDCIIREIEEETGISLKPEEVTFKGIITWETDLGYQDGLYVFLADIPSATHYETPQRTAEGILDWKKISWLLSPGQLGAGEMIPHYLPNVLNCPAPLKHVCILHNKKLIRYEYTHLN